jgi:hypothetical protein
LRREARDEPNRVNYDLAHQLAEERARRIAAEASAALAPTNDAVGDLEMEMNLVRGPDGRVKSPIQITSSAGDYEMRFDRSANGRIKRVTIKPRNG